MDKSDLVPLREARSLTSDVWNKHTSNEHYNRGLQCFVDELLPDDSKEILKELLTSVNE